MDQVCRNSCALILQDVDDIQPEISIIIRSKNEERFINQTLAAIFQQKVEYPFEVILIDSGSTDRTLEIARTYNVRLYEIDNRDFSYGRALNYGANLARGRYLINLSAHCIPKDLHWMSRLVGVLRRDPKIAATYGGQVAIKGLNPFEERSLKTTFKASDDLAVRPPFSNANCAVRRATWEKYPFDEKASFAEDFIWSQMLPKEHRIMYIPDAAVYHTHPLQLRFWAKRCYDNGVFVQYLEHVYGLQYRWAKGHTGGSSKNADWSDFFGMFGRRAVRCLTLLGFLIENRYFRFIPLLPIYVALEYYYYQKGLTDGFRLYGEHKSPIP